MTRLDPEDPSRPLEPDKSLGELFGELAHELGDLVATQTELAKAEIKNEADKAKKVAGAFGGAAVTAYLAIVLLSFAAAWGLSEIVPEGVAFLIVGLIYAGLALVMFQRGRAKAKEINLIPPETAQSLREDVQWAQQKLS